MESEKKSEHGGFMIRGETGLTMSFGNPYSLHRINLPAPKPYTFSKPSYPQASKYLINNRFKQPPNITKVIQPITKKPKQEDTDSSLDDDHKREQNPID